MSLSNSQKQKLREVVEAVTAGDLDKGMVWDTSYKPIHGLGTSRLQGYKLGSQKTSTGTYNVAIWSVSKMRLAEPKWVEASFDEEPTGEAVIEALNNLLA
ncbi:SubName: Full=Uncharacterized protein {ECO:0000313/EMBL:CCA71888.1} [Serendipita indica DSM 11827]|nr:SubName: Full=Uncharacterized protein {ECO:0000313/EMBL:CCA71888.1} [Serendipita indica DSM 11827]